MNKQELEKELIKAVDNLQGLFMYALKDIETKREENVALKHNDIKETIKSLEAATIKQLENLLQTKYDYDSQALEEFKAKNKVGEITEKNYLSIHVGSGNIKGNDDKNFDFQLELGAVTSSPLVHYKWKYFVLTWEDILKLAENAGLFEEIDNKVGV